MYSLNTCVVPVGSVTQRHGVRGRSAGLEGCRRSDSGSAHKRRADDPPPSPNSTQSCNGENCSKTGPSGHRRFAAPNAWGASQPAAALDLASLGGAAEALLLRVLRRPCACREPAPRAAKARRGGWRRYAAAAPTAPAAAARVGFLSLARASSHLCRACVL